MRTITKESNVSSTSTVAVQKDDSPTPKTKTIQSRFGELEINPSLAIAFKHGILGIPGSIHFCLTDLPDQDTEQFKLLQCVEDESLCFITVPSQYDNQLLEPKDLDEACKLLDIDAENLLVMFIVTVHVEEDARHLSVNAKAPILIDAISKHGTQYVFQNPAYQIKHMIS